MIYSAGGVSCLGSCASICDFSFMKSGYAFELVGNWPTMLATAIASCVSRVRVISGSFIFYFHAAAEWAVAIPDEYYA